MKKPVPSIMFLLRPVSPEPKRRRGAASHLPPDVRRSDPEPLARRAVLLALKRERRGSCPEFVPRLLKRRAGQKKTFVMWTEEERAELVAKYAVGGPDACELSLRRHTRAAVRATAVRLGVHFRERRG